jgi:hypothetical protein
MDASGIGVQHHDLPSAPLAATDKVEGSDAPAGSMPQILTKRHFKMFLLVMLSNPILPWHHFHALQVDDLSAVM